MRFTNLLKTALRSLNRNKLRSFLTMLGIIIGVASVIAMLSIGEGSSKAIQAEISNLGTNVLTIRPGASFMGGVMSEAGTSKGLQIEDIKTIEKRCGSIAYISPVARTGGQVVAGAKNWRTSIYGTYPDYFTIRNYELSYGNLFSLNDERGAAKVCVIGLTVVENLFEENINPIGKMIRIKKIPFKIIGVLDKKGQTPFGGDQDDIIIAPFSTVQKRMLASTNLSQILVSAQSDQIIPQAKEELKEVITDTHKSGFSFTVRAQADLVETADATLKTLTALLASIAGISLLVGGIGIMNIMLVSVTERTREIGLRMAVGAKGSDVLLQFLIESILLSFLGGFLGIVLGGLIAYIVSNLMAWPPVISLQSIFLSFLFATMIGIFFGFYPARKAAMLNPIDALRYE